VVVAFIRFVIAAEIDSDEPICDRHVQ
jgi:hypothetical protein